MTQIINLNHSVKELT